MKNYIKFSPMNKEMAKITINNMTIHCKRENTAFLAANEMCAAMQMKRPFEFAYMFDDLLYRIVSEDDTKIIEETKTTCLPVSKEEIAQAMIQDFKKDYEYWATETVVNVYEETEVDEGEIVSQYIDRDIKTELMFDDLTQLEKLLKKDS